VVVSFNMSEEAEAFVEALASASGVSKSQVVERCLLAVYASMKNIRALLDDPVLGAACREMLDRPDVQNRLAALSAAGSKSLGVCGGESPAMSFEAFQAYLLSGGDVMPESSSENGSSSGVTVQRRRPFKRDVVIDAESE